MLYSKCKAVKTQEKGNTTMKVRVEVDSDLQEECIVIHCKELDERILKLQKVLKEHSTEDKSIFLKKNDTDYYMPLNDIIFFETENKENRAHTRNDIFETEYKLYELEELLPGFFMRISKSTIVNLNHIYSITRNLTASSMIEFSKSHKKVYVSRHYYKALIERLEEKRRKL